MKLRHSNDIEIILPKSALEVVFDECDRFDHDETGGRIIGTYEETKGTLVINVEGIIEPGPNTRRSPVMLFQDGDYQEKIFRKIEKQHPSVEHLGTWHTHHMNGLQTLSGGDIATYSRTVNHSSQNTNFFYALLVVAKHKGHQAAERYTYKHFVFRRGDENFYEVAHRHVKIIDSPLLWPQKEGVNYDSRHRNADITPSFAAHQIYRKNVQPPHRSDPEGKPHIERVYDKDIISEFYKGVKPFNSTKLGFYWRGPIDLADGSELEAVLVEDSTHRQPTYSLILRNAPLLLKSLAERLANQEFSSARAALITAERQCNKVIFERGNRPPG